MNEQDDCPNKQGQLVRISMVSVCVPEPSCRRFLWPVPLHRWELHGNRNQIAGPRRDGQKHPGMRQIFTIWSDWVSLVMAAVCESGIFSCDWVGWIEESTCLTTVVTGELRIGNLDKCAHKQIKQSGCHNPAKTLVILGSNPKRSGKTAPQLNLHSYSQVVGFKMTENHTVYTSEWTRENSN